MAIRFTTNFGEAAPVEYYFDQEEEPLTAQEATAVALADIARSLRKIADEQHDQSALMSERMPYP